MPAGDETEVGLSEVQLAFNPQDTAIYNMRGLFKLVYANQVIITRNQGVLERNQQFIMAQLDPVNAKLDQIQQQQTQIASDVNTQMQQTQQLRDQIAALQAGSVTQAQIDALVAKADAILGSQQSTTAVLQGDDPAAESDRLIGAT
jgi:septal ring factor EnvC (AmiA/AmiB activator)